MTSAKMYRNLHHREDAGWLAGLSTGQAVLVGTACVPVVVVVAAGRWAAAFGWLMVAVVVWALTTIPIRGRAAAHWLVDLGMFTTGVLMAWSPWQSRAAAGRALDPDAADLPGVLARFRFHDGPPLSDQRLCVIQDSVDGRWAVTGRLTHSGVAMASPAECEGLAEQLGTMLIGVAHREVIDRVSLLVRTVPDDGTDYACWREQHEIDGAPGLTRRIAAEIDRDVAAASVRTELFVTVCGTEHSLRRAAKAAGGGVAGRAYALYRGLDGVADALRALGDGASRISPEAIDQLPQLG